MPVLVHSQGLVRVENSGRGALVDDRRAGDAVAGGEPGALVDGELDPRPPVEAVRLTALDQGAVERPRKRLDPRQLGRAERPMPRTLIFRICTGGPSIVCP